MVPVTDSPEGLTTGWAAIPRWVLWETHLSSAARLVLVALLARENRDGVCWPSHARIAQDTALGVTSVKNALTELREAGLVSWETRQEREGGQGTNLYQVRFVHSQPPHAYPLAAGRRPVAATRLPPSRHATTPQSPGGDEQETKNNQQRTSTRDDSDTESYPEAFLEFMDAYPRPVAHAAALRAWRVATETVDPDVLTKAAAAFARAERDTEPRFVIYPSRWLNERRWEDRLSVRETPTPPAFVPEPTGGGPPPEALRASLRVRPQTPTHHAKEAIS